MHAHARDGVDTTTTTTMCDIKLGCFLQCDVTQCLTYVKYDGDLGVCATLCWDVFSQRDITPCLTYVNCDNDLWIQIYHCISAFLSKAAFCRNMKIVLHLTALRYIYVLWYVASFSNYIYICILMSFHNMKIDT